MQKIEKILIVLIVLIIIAVIVLSIVLMRSDKQQEEKEISEESESIEYQKDNSIKDVGDEQIYFNVSGCVQKYLNYISIDADKDIEEMSREEILFVQSQGIDNLEAKRKGIYNLLDKTYIQENNITESNVLEKLEYVNDDFNINFVPEKMKYVEGYFVQEYSVQGIIENNDNPEDNKEVFYIVTIDKLDTTFSIKPLDSTMYKDIEDINIKKTEERIEKNANNQYTETTLMENDIAQKYFTDYKKKSLNDIEKAYTVLDEEYKQKRFGNFETYKKYIDKNRSEIDGIIATQYLVNYYDDYKEYVCKDQYDNIYIFHVTASMQYTVQLDTYTLDNEKFLKTYNASNDQNKVAMNIDKWVQMLNNRDYQAAFNVLDETFRTTNFDNDVDKFEEYMRQYFPEHYDLEFGEFSEETGTYMQEVALTYETVQNVIKNETTIYMELGEGTDFVMSFNLIRN